MSNEQVPSIPQLLRLGDRITVLPIVHGSGQFAWLTRRFMLQHAFDCIAVPLPPSFQEPVESAVVELPRPAVVIQRPMRRFDSIGSYGIDDESETDPTPSTFVPIDPCQGVIMAIRAAMGEHIPRAFIDRETENFQPFSGVMPDPYAVRHVRPETFAAAVLPSIPRPADESTRLRLRFMASRLRELERTYSRILLVTSVMEWPWIRESWTNLTTKSMIQDEVIDEEPVDAPETFPVDPRTLMFLFGELPFITSLYERARAELEEDENLQIDGVKELLIAAKDSYRTELGKRARRVSPLLLAKCLQYTRNLSLMHRRMTPDMITIVTAAQQILGDQYAIHVAEMANRYEINGSPVHRSDSATDQSIGASVNWHPDQQSQVTLGIDQARLPSGEMVAMVNRLPGPPITWQTLSLQRRPTELEKSKWQTRWNPYAQCSWPPEDERIEVFRTRVCERAQAILGQDLAQTEKFTTSVKDGIDIRDTLRHWYERQIYVKVLPPSRGKLDACLMIFDSPADPRDYPWRTTWFAEHEWESTLAFYASDFRREMVGPGIGLGIYGGAMFLYPPLPIRDIWTDSRLDFTETLEERLVAAACLHSRARQIALVSTLPPGAGWRKLARRYKKHLIHVPLSSFSDQEVQQLRMVHVLNGGQVRSYAANFIRRV